ncbi:MAG: signal peptidase II [Chrysiogenales bacterium]
MAIKSKKFYFFIMLGIVALDQASKWLVVKYIPLESTVNLVKGFFRFWHVRNSGAIWGFFQGHSNKLIPVAITVLAIAALLIVSYFFLRTPGSYRLELTAYTLILGGALGNIIDRLRLGYVIDFLDMFVKSWHWPTYNVADSCITIGVLLLALSMWRGKCIQY